MKKATGKSNLAIVRDYLSGTRPFTMVGWVPDMEKRKNGDIWEDAQGNKWVQKNGYKRRINKIGALGDLIREECSVCKFNIKIGTSIDRKVFMKTGRCYDCECQSEIQKMADVDYNKALQIKRYKDEKHLCLEVKVKLEEGMNHIKTSPDKLSFFNDDGSEEFWTDTMKTQILENAEADYKDCLEALERVNLRLSELGVTE